LQFNQSGRIYADGKRLVVRSAFHIRPDWSVTGRTLLIAALDV